MPPEGTANGNVAVSLRLPWKQVAALIDIVVPLRRPKRTAPSPSLKDEIAGWDAASDEAWESIDE
jgi:hypothetical protein